MFVASKHDIFQMQILSEFHTLQYCKFSKLEIMERFEIDAFSLLEINSKWKKKKKKKKYFLMIVFICYQYLNMCRSSRIVTFQELLDNLKKIHLTPWQTTHHPFEFINVIYGVWTPQSITEFNCYCGQNQRPF